MLASESITFVEGYIKKINVSSWWLSSQVNLCSLFYCFKVVCEFDFDSCPNDKNIAYLHSPRLLPMCFSVSST